MYPKLHKETHIPLGEVTQSELEEATMADREAELEEFECKAHFFEKVFFGVYFSCFFLYFCIFNCIFTYYFLLGMP